MSIFTNTFQVTSISIQIVMVLAGQWTARGAPLTDVLLDPMQGLWVQGNDQPLDISPTGLASELVSIAIEPVEQ